MNDASSRQPPEGRSARKRREIVAAATTVFLRNGYLGTSMDEIAGLAAVSKQTVYKHFADKETLFAEILRGTVEGANAFEQVAAAAASDSANDSGDLVKTLNEVAKELIAFLLRLEVRQLRRLVIGEAGRFPALGRSWYDQGFQRGMAALATAFQKLAEDGQLRIDDPQLAANHFAGLVLWVPVNRIMFCGDQEHLSDAETERYAQTGVRAFLAAYGHA